MQLIPPIRALTRSALARRLLTTTIWSALGELISRGSMLLSLVIAARILGKADYGQFGLVRSTINAFAAFGGAVLGLTANKFIARARDNDKAYAGQIIGSSYTVAAAIGLLGGGLVLTGSGFLGSSVLSTPQFAGALRVAALLLALGAVYGAQMGILQGLEAYRRFAGGALIQGGTALVAITLGSYFLGLKGALGGLLVYSLGGIVIFHTLIRRESARLGIRISYTRLDRIWPILWSFSVPTALMAFAVAPLKWLAEVALARDSGFQSLAVFQASITMAYMLLALVSTCNAPLVSLLANLPEGKASARLHYVTLYGSWYIFLILALPFVIFPQLGDAVFGARYATAEFHASALCLILYGGLLAYYQGVMRLVTQYGSMWFGSFTNLCEGVTLITAFHFLPGGGAVRLAFAYICSYIVRIVVTTPTLLKNRIVPPALIFDRYFLVSLVGFATLVVLRVAHSQ